MAIFGTKSRRVLRKTFRWSWVVTFPLASLFVIWMVRTGTRFYDFGVRYNTFGGKSTLYNVGKMEFEHLLRLAELSLTPDHPQTGDGLRRVNLYVQDGDQAKLNRNLPASGLEYVEGALAYPDGSVNEVSLRYRGDFNWHWAMYKKSIRVKTKRSALWEGLRKFNLIAPKEGQVVAGYLGYWLGAEMDLLAPRAELVELNVNGKYRGVHLMVEQIEELLLRNSYRMPGDIFAGELMGKDGFDGVSTHVFRHPGLWEKVAINNHFADEANDSLVRLCDLVNGPRTEEHMAELRELVDLEAFGRFAAYRVLTQTLHFSETHNWRLYYDPWKNRFEPIVWDPDAWHPGWVPKPGKQIRPDIIHSALDDALSRDYQYIHAQHAALVDYFESGLHERFMNEFDRVVESATGSIHNDPSLVNAFEYFTPEQTLRKIAKMRRSIVDITEQVYQLHLGADARLSYEFAGDNPNDDELRIGLGVLGRRPTDRLAIEFMQRPQQPMSVALAYYKNGERVEVDVTGAASLQGHRLVLERPLLASYDFHQVLGQRMRTAELRESPGIYELVLRGLTPAGNLPTDVRSGYGEDDWLRGFDAGKALPPAEHNDSFGIVVPAPAVEPRVMSGTMVFNDVEVIHGPVVIMPGTVLRMGPGASLIINGKVKAVGTSDEKIRIVPRDKEQEPWGVFAIRGEAAAGSTFGHCVFSGGSGHKEPLAEYSAMFSIHAVPDVSIYDCIFRDSQVVDDMVHAVYSTLHFDSCTFTNSLFDALDLDVCTGSVVRCEFIRSGNDALDLMASEIAVKDCLLLESVDKGLSVGEGTKALIINCRMLRCEIGVQIKDGSMAAISNCDFTDNVKAVDAYKKNWRYNAGGSAFLYGCIVEGGESTLTADKYSRIYVHDSWIDRLGEPNKRIFLGRSVDVAPSIKGHRAAQDKRSFQFDDDATQRTESFTGFLRFMRHKQRGAKK
jgi:CotH protein/parallel beta helix pectate lyase-like protein